MRLEPRPATERLQRVLLPRVGEPRDVRSLYLIEQQSRGRVHATSRTAAELPAGGEVSFATYFGAFPASYWRRWSQLDQVVLRVEVTGTVRVDVYRSKWDGTRIAVDGALVSVDADGRGTVEFTLSLAPFEDGGWLWFDLTCDSSATLEAAAWYAPAAAGPQQLPDGTRTEAAELRAAIGIPTFNRPADAVAALHALASDPEVDAAVDCIIMPDQGTRHPADEPDFAEVAGHFGDRLRLIHQGNLGGSGGYSRIMFEALEHTDSPHILYMDDDIAIEPDSVLRAIQAARYATSPTIIGGQMLNLLERSRLHSMGEVVDRGSFMWAHAPHVHYEHDFARYPLTDREVVHQKGTTEPQDNRDLHRRIDVDYNGWWMCLFPRVVAEAAGQPLPLFIKWDDTEYSLRAAGLGFPTVTWPGVAIWHMSWGDKDDAIDWQAYFHLRNRLIVAALHLDGDVSGLVRDLRKATAKHLMCQEYSTAAILNEAMRDFLAGPEQLFGILESALPRVQGIRREYPDATVVPSAAALPAPTGAPVISTDDRLPLRTRLKAAAQGLVHSLRPADLRHHTAPQANLTPLEARWYNLARLDGATVTTADGRGVFYRRRDRDVAVSLGREAFALQGEVARRFDEMRGRYRAALPQLTSRKAWSDVFDAQ